MKPRLPPENERKTQASFSVALEEFDDLPLRPAAVVAVRLGQKAAVAAVPGLDELYVAIGQQPGAARGRDGDEGIVLGMDHQGGHRDALDERRGAGAGVVIVGAGESP